MQRVRPGVGQRSSGWCRAPRWARALPICAAVLLLASPAYARLGGFVSPGDLAEAHAELEGLTRCTKCHEAGAGVSAERCLECHEEVQTQVRTRRGYHADLDELCERCHPDHRGRDFDMVQLDPERFNHQSTGFALAGGHEIECEECHIERDTWTGLSRACESCHGEILGTPEGLDRLGALAQARLSLDPHLELHARVDLQYPDRRGGSPLVDAAVFVRGRPHRSLDLELLYDAYSSVRYLRSVDRDPAARRFALRAEALGLTEGVPQELNDPTIHHLVGFSGRWHPGLDGTRLRPTLGLDLRYRHHAEVSRRFARASLRGGLLGIGSRLDLLLDGGVLMVDRRPRGELGLSGLLELGKQRLVALDASARLSLLPGDEGGVAPAWYGDLFVDVVTPFGLVLAAGVYGEGLSVPQGWDVAIGGLARITWRVRLRRPRAPRFGSRSESPAGSRPC